MKLVARSFIFAFATFASISIAYAQSTDQNFPTPVTTTEISGTIRARDVGDSRLTSYYYTFDGSQGDLFINIVTRNLTGDIDVFTKNGLTPLTKIIVFADYGENETGRVIYLRKPENLILRVQGRTPSDEPASFRIKFAGSFLASTAAPPAEPEIPTPTAKNESGIRVNSVGTIVEIIPKATPAPAVVETSEEAPEKVVSTEKKEETPEKVASTEEKKEETAPEEAGTKETPAEKKIGVVVTDNLPPAEESETAPATPRRRTARSRRRVPPAEADPKTETPTTGAPSTQPPPPARITRRGRTTTPKTTEPPTPDPLADVNLVILFKDGSKIERPMTEVLRFTVDRGVLTVISRDGTVGRYSILDVAKVTIE